MADRVCRPSSPKTACSSRLAPSTTAGCSWKSGVEATKPVTVSTRSTRSRLPRALFEHGQRVERAHLGRHARPRPR